jgi:endogenous inhibitor of DNA gyrase (YacG/DUF329 family)
MPVVKCPTCGAESNLSFDEPTYSGPFRCWKCRGTFLVGIQNEKLNYLEPISEEELEKYKK